MAGVHLYPLPFKNNLAGEKYAYVFQPAVAGIALCGILLIGSSVLTGCEGGSSRTVVSPTQNFIDRSYRGDFNLSGGRNGRLVTNITGTNSGTSTLTVDDGRAASSRAQIGRAIVVSSLNPDTGVFSGSGTILVAGVSIPFSFEGNIFTNIITLTLSGVSVTSPLFDITGGGGVMSVSNTTGTTGTIGTTGTTGTTTDDPVTARSTR